MLFASLAVATVLTAGSSAYAEEPTIASVATASAVEAPPGTLPVFAQAGLPEADAIPLGRDEDALGRSRRRHGQVVTGRAVCGAA